MDYYDYEFKISAKGFVKILGAIIGLVGLGLIVYNETIKVYLAGNWVNVKVYPYQIIGAIVALIGFVTLVIGYAIPQLEQVTPTPSAYSEVCCGKCPFYRTSKCERQERNYDAVPCTKFYS